jgi:predicted ester cyclase
MRDWFHDLLDALNRHDLDALAALIDPAVRRAHRPAGAAAWLAELEDLFTGFPDWRWKRILVVVEEDRIAAHLRGSGTHAGPFRGVAPTRRHVNVAEFAFYRIAGGRIVEVTGSGDDEVLSAIGGRA